MSKKPGRVIFRAIGGLGNQLFVLHAAAAHALHFGVSFRIDTRRSAKGIKQGGPHNLPSQLSSLLINSELMSKYQIHPVVSFTLDTLASIESKIYSVTKSSKNSTWSHTSHSPGFDAAVFEKRALYFRGYFQSYKYLSYLRDAGQEFSLSLVNPSQSYSEISTTLSGEDFTVVHIRRGDYLTVAKNFGSLSVGYYTKALTYLDQTVGAKKVLVFSDDDEIYRDESLREIFTNYEASFISTSKLDPAEALLLMSKGTRFIIANSSFSWWAAALSKSEDVIYPSVWFRRDNQPESLAFPSWKALESQWN